MLGFSATLFADEPVTLPTGATIEIFQAEAAKANGYAVIVCPGGGYAYRADVKEGTGCAPFLNNLGFTVAALKYRVPKGNHEGPLADGRAAMKYLRDHAQELGIRPDRIGVMGFSAGGHLASTIATHTEGEERPAFQILIYPVITMEAGKTHQGSINELLGRDPSPELVQRYSNQLRVNVATPPAYIVYSEDDGAVPPATNGKAYYDALVKCGVPVCLKTYPTGGHGWGLGNNRSPEFAAQVQADLAEWLNNFNSARHE